MNKKQLIIMWVGIVLMALIWYWAPRELIKYKSEYFEYNVGTAYNIVQPAKLFANWILVGVFTSAMIITFKDKKPKDEQKQ